MKTKLLKLIRAEHAIFWNKYTREWNLCDLTHTRALYRHPNLDWILTRAFEDIFGMRKGDKMGSKLFSRTLCRTSRIFHRNKVLGRKN